MGLGLRKNHPSPQTGEFAVREMASSEQVGMRSKASAAVVMARKRRYIAADASGNTAIFDVR